MARVVTRSIDPWGWQLNPQNGNLLHQSAQADNLLTSRPSSDSKHRGCNALTVPSSFAGVNLTSADYAALERGLQNSPFAAETADSRKFGTVFCWTCKIGRWGRPAIFRILQVPLESRWSDRALAERAGLQRVNAVAGGEIIGRNSGNYTGIVILYFSLRSDRVRGYRLRRDHPDLEWDAAGNLKPKQKYLTTPGYCLCVWRDGLRSRQATYRECR